MSTERWQSKAQDFATAWRIKLGAFPSKHCICLALAHGEHETRNGDAWPGEHNVGAIQLRILNEGEKKAIADAGVRLPNSFAEIDACVSAARAALAAAVEAGTIPEPRGKNGEGAALHVDSSPGKGWYWVFFRACQDDVEGFAVFVHIIAEQRASCRAVLESDSGTAQAYALALYASRYYEGFRKPASWYAVVNGKWAEVPAGTDGAITGKQLNVQDYGGALLRILPGIQLALADWTPTLPGPDPVALANAARLSKLSADLMAGRGEGLGALDDLIAADTEPPDVA